MYKTMIYLMIGLCVLSGISVIIIGKDIPVPAFLICIFCLILECIEDLVEEHKK